jgi:hypothetical protein
MGTQRRTIPNIRRDLSSVTRPNIEQLKSQGQALRERVPRSSHAEWAAPRTRPDPIKLLQHSDRGRLPDLLPIRYDRMCQSPFAFFRGSAAVMACDLSKTPATGIRVRRAAIATLRISAVLRAPSGGCCSTSTISTRRFRLRGNGTSNA